ncbi:MAG TPA: SDR family oxidoreductase [Candidatus Micrarchaeaceae archaeon]|nr:SDR family oxidoreductase [Candidatus Micrarchaeaceae archaeon]
MGRLDGKVAIITGGAGDFGAAASRRFVAEGCRVCVADIDADRGNELARELGEAAFFATCDHTDARAAADAVAQTVSRWGKLTTLFNNAGIIWSGDFDAADDAVFARVLEVDLMGVVRMTHAALPALRDNATRDTQAGSSVLITSSGLGLRGAPGTSAYAVAKHALVGLMRSLGQELGPENIRVNALCPGASDTAGMRAAWPAPDETLRNFKDRTPLRRNVEPLDVANAAVFLASDEARNIHSHSLAIDGGIYGL